MKFVLLAVIMILCTFSCLNLRKKKQDNSVSMSYSAQYSSKTTTSHSGNWESFLIKSAESVECKPMPRSELIKFNSIVF